MEHEVEMVGPLSEIYFGESIFFNLTEFEGGRRVGWNLFLFSAQLALSVEIDERKIPAVGMFPGFRQANTHTALKYNSFQLQLHLPSSHRQHA